MIQIILWFCVVVFFYNIFAFICKKGHLAAIASLWPFDKQKTKKVLHRMFIGFLIYLTFAAFLSAFLKLFNIDV